MSDHTPSESPSCRLCLVTPAEVDPQRFLPILDEALAAGDIASLIIAVEATSPAAAKRIAELIVPRAEARGVAALVLDDPAFADAVGADGVHAEAGVAAGRAAIERFRGRRIVGIGGLRSRHEAMQAGEAEPDYVFFGRLDGDRFPTIDHRALDLAGWWAGIFEIPAIVMGGHDIDSVTEAAKAGVEFVALRRAIWEHEEGPAAAIRAATALLAAGEPA